MTRPAKPRRRAAISNASSLRVWGLSGTVPSAEGVAAGVDSDFRRPILHNATFHEGKSEPPLAFGRGKSLLRSDENPPHGSLDSSRRSSYLAPRRAREGARASSGHRASLFVPSWRRRSQRRPD